MQDLRPPLSLAHQVFGVPATVTPPGGSPISTTAVWILPQTVEVPLDSEFQRAERRRILALRRDQVPAVPRGTVIAAPEVKGGAVLSWRVDGVDRLDAEEFRVLVIPQ